MNTIEHNIIKINQQIFKRYNKDYLEINEVLDVLNSDFLPVNIEITDNLISIRQISEYLSNNNLKPHIIKN